MRLSALLLVALAAAAACAQNAEISTTNRELHISGAKTVFATDDLSSPTSFGHVVDLIANLTARLEVLETFRTNVIATSQCAPGYVIASINSMGVATCNKSSAISSNSFCPLGTAVRGVNPDFSLACQAQPGNANFDLRFQHADASSYVEVDDALPTSLEEFSVTFWYNTKTTKAENWVASYFATKDNDLLVQLYPLKIWIAGSMRTLGDYRTPRDGLWHHITITFQRSSATLVGYLDGAQIYSSTSVTGVNPVPPGGLLTVGQDQDSKGGGFTTFQAYDGMLSNFNIYPAFFTADTVEKAYCGASLPVQPAVSWIQLLDKVVGPGDITYLRPSGVPAHPCVGTASGNACSPNYAMVAVAPNGQVTCAPVFPTALNNTVADLVSRVQKTESFQSAMQASPCPASQFAAGVGDSGMLKCAGSADFDLSFENPGIKAYIKPRVAVPALTAFTMATWIKGDYKPDNFIVSYAAGAPFDNNALLIYTHLLGVNMYQVGFRVITSKNVVLDGDWHHLAYVWYGPNITAYVDGVAFGSATVPASLTAIPGGGSYVIGQEQDGSSLDAITLEPLQRFQGQLSQFFFLTVAATAAQIADMACSKDLPPSLTGGALMAWPTLRNDLVGAENGLYVISPSTAPVACMEPQTCPVGQSAVSFDKRGAMACAAFDAYAVELNHTTDDQYLYPRKTIPIMPALTLSMWISTTEPTAQFLVSYAAPVPTTGTGGNDIMIQYLSSALSVYFNGANKQFSSGLPNLRDGRWHHLVFAWAAADNSASLFVDGRLMQTVVGTNAAWTQPIAGGGAFLIGQEQDDPLVTAEAQGVKPKLDANQRYNGLVSGVNLYSRRFTDVRKLYSSQCDGGATFPEGDILPWSIFQSHVVGPDLRIIRPFVDLRGERPCPA